MFGTVRSLDAGSYCFSGFESHGVGAKARSPGNNPLKRLLREIRRRPRRRRFPRQGISTQPCRGSTLHGVWAEAGAGQPEMKVRILETS